MDLVSLAINERLSVRVPRMKGTGASHTSISDGGNVGMYTWNLPMRTSAL